MMADDIIQIKIEGLDELMRAINKFPQESAKYLGQAGMSAARDLLQTQGLKKYPPETAANAPPTPYYIRGSGTQYKSYLKKTSENLGRQWYYRNVAGGYGTEIGNSASYAKWVHGEEQASFMAPKGWRKLRDVVDEKIDKIIKVYQLWVDKLLRDIGLR